MLESDSKAPAENGQLKPRGSGKALPTSWWSVDPGEVHVGIAMWNEYELEHCEETSPLGLQDYLIDAPPLLMIIESFTLLSPKWNLAKAKQAVATIKLIGAAHALMRLHGFPVVEQAPSVRHVAQASPWWRDLELPANGHVRSAAAHGLYYARFAKR